MKRCRKCDIDKPLEDFQKASRRKDGHSDYCRPCKSMIDKEYRESKKDEINANRRVRYEDQKDEISLRNRRSYRKHKDKRIAYVTQWGKNNPQRRALYNAKRKALKLDQLGIIPPDCYEILVSLFGERCLRCGSTERLEMDHILALANGGLHCIMNLQILCKSCNSWKGDRVTIDYRPVKYYYEEAI